MNNKMKLGIAALTSVLLLASCGGGSVTPPTTISTGVVTVPSNPNGYTLTIRDSNNNVVAPSNYNKLAPGNYTATYSKTGFQSNTQSFTITAGGSSNIYYPTLVANSMPGAFYLDANGQAVAITQADLNNAGTRFVFYAWLENDAEGGIDPSMVGVNGAMTAPTLEEQDEVAPIMSQNLVAGYVGYRADNGTVYPVVGANVRWDIVTPFTSIRFSAADDGGQPSGAPMSPQDINDNALSANTYTNSATGNNARFPSSTQYPLYNMTGVGSPDKSGFTWTALNIDPMNPDQFFFGSTARVRAIAYINGTEIDKQFMTKTFAPSANLEIEKTIDPTTVGLNQPATVSVTVRNTGQGAANNIQLSDVLRTDNAAAYSITAPADGTANNQDGFDATFNLEPGETRTFTFTAQSNAVGVYCDMATITSYENGAFGTVTPSGLSDDACLTVQAPNLNITKTLGTVDANGNFTPSTLGQVVDPNTPVYARITVTNNGTAPATNVTVTDSFVAGEGTNYSIDPATLTSSPTVTPTLDPSGDGFIAGPFNLAPNASQTFTFAASGTANGEYCDQGSFTATSNNTDQLSGTSDRVCFTVASPILNITKVNSQAENQPATTSLNPGSSYLSTITVTNNGTGDARNVVVRDVLGQLTNGNTFMNYGSGSYVVSGTAQTGSVTFDAGTRTVTTVPSTLTLAPGQSLTLTLTSTVPAGAPAGEYCDTGSYTSTNGGTNTARDCVTVVSYIAEQTQLTDTVDPIRAGDPQGTILASAAIVEPGSNEGAINNVLTYNFGVASPQQTAPGIFSFSETQVYYDPTPTRDPQTGAVSSDYTNSTSTLLSIGSGANQYTVDAASGTGVQTVTLNPAFRVQPGGVIWVRTQVTAPVGADPTAQYFETFTWNNTADVSNRTRTNFKTESTTVLAPITPTN